MSASGAGLGRSLSGKPTRPPAAKILPFAPMHITQEDLVEEYLQRQELKRCKDEHQCKRGWIKMQLILGATIEPGPRNVRLEERFRENSKGFLTSYRVLLFD